MPYIMSYDRLHIVGLPYVFWSHKDGRKNVLCARPGDLVFPNIDEARWVNARSIGIVLCVLVRGSVIERIDVAWEGE